MSSAGPVTDPSTNDPRHAVDHHDPRHVEPTRWQRLRRRYFAVLVITLVVGVVGSLFVFSYSSALGDPHPDRVPVGLVTSDFGAASVDTALHRATGTTFEVTDYATRAAALDAIEHQKVYGAVVFDSSTTATLYTSAASSNAVATLLVESKSSIEKALGVTLHVEALHPLHAKDPSGTVLFYIALATVILGFVGAIQIRVNVGGLKLYEALLADLGRCIVVSLFLTLTIVVIGRLETTPFAELWGVLTFTMLVSSMTVTLFRLIVGPKWGLLPTWVLFVVVANPSSGGAVAPQLLPPLYQAIGRFLPTGAAVQAVRDITYFPAAVHVEPFVILALWLVVTTVLVIVLRRRKERRVRARAHELDDVNTRAIATQVS